MMFAAAALFFAGCSESDDDDAPVDDYSAATRFVVVVSSPASTILYFSFENGFTTPEAVANSTDWDIAFTNNRVIKTNSGVTASTLSSGGLGGVWYTGWTTFKNLTALPADADFTKPYATDISKYVNASADAEHPTGNGMPTSQNPLNVMTYIGYSFGDGESDGTNYGTDGHAPFGGYLYNADAFYKMVEGQMGVYEPTRKVYIIKHGDGSGYTELQIESMETGTNSSRVYTGYYQNIIP
jgi:hypothetical protein